MSDELLRANVIDLADARARRVDAPHPPTPIVRVKPCPDIPGSVLIEIDGEAFVYELVASPDAADMFATMLRDAAAKARQGGA